MDDRLTIDPEKQDDRFYRYKMPAVVTKVEGKGNGIKTVLPNIGDIATRCLNRNPEYPVKYFGTDLGATTKWKDDKWIIMGEHDQPKLQKSLFGYIKKFVLCRKCRNPETNTYLDSQKNAFIRCGACGKDSSLDMGEKIINLLVKNEKQISTDSKSKKSKKSSSEDKTPENDEDSMVRSLAAYIDDSDPPPAPSELTLKLNALKAEHGLKKKDLVKILSRAVFWGVDTYAERTRMYTPTLKKFVSDSTEKYLLEAAEMLVFTDAYEAPEAVFPAAVHHLLLVEVVSPEAVLDWFEGKPHKADKDLSARNKQLCGDIAAELAKAVDEA
eukprot:TRINITY_DN11364_c0_g1_i2.p2 TRINITY_DN11364_c0_g1~~TRINITY_DN11364_c0_g1_i2.p2  ORF type:complete len:327 (+),score=171.87 TRINITY_DN11364_c0_g1_i2:110-1090(+)